MTGSSFSLTQPSSLACRTTPTVSLHPSEDEPDGRLSSHPRHKRTDSLHSDDDLTPFIRSQELPTSRRDGSVYSSPFASSTSFSIACTLPRLVAAVACVGLLVATLGFVLALAVEGRLVAAPHITSQLGSLRLSSQPSPATCDPHSRLPLNFSSTAASLNPLDVLLVQKCLGWGVESSPSAASSASHCPSPSAPLSSAFDVASPAQVRCQLSPSSVISTFFPSQLALYPGVLTHRPILSCERGVFVLIDEPYRDGMGNGLWSYAVVLSFALALNATVVHDDFHATHSESEGVRMREEVLRFAEWEVSREAYDRCPPSSPVRINVIDVDEQFFDFSPSDPVLAATRAKVRALQVSWAHGANTTHMGATLDATSTVRYLHPEHLNYTHFELPRVDFISPGMTVRFKSLKATHDILYKGGLLPPAVDVARILEMRYLAQQDGWRARLFPQDLEDMDVAEDRTQRPLRSWRTSDRIHVAVPVRRGDVTRWTAGSQLTVNLDLRDRAVTDEAVLQLLEHYVQLTKDIDAFPISTCASSTLPATLTGTDLLRRMQFTVYSEGSEAEFAPLYAAVIALGLEPSQVRLQLGGRTSWVFHLMVESDVMLLSPSSYSWAAGCYFNSESLKVGSGWSFTRFYGCKNFVFAPWTRYTPNAITERDVPIQSIRRSQTWKIDNGTEFQQRLVRLVQRKWEQRRRLEPIVTDNYGDYQTEWMYATRQQSDNEVRYD